MEINLLDMGMTQYGDSLLITNGDRRILIDCGHPGDTNSIRLQLKKLLNQDPPFDIDLLVITHCHVDHIGCCPDLVKLGDIKPKIALLADEKIGFGSVLSNDDAVTDGSRTLFTALDEEDRSDLQGDALEQFLFDAANLQSKYHSMVEQLKADLGDNVRIFTGIEDDYTDLEQRFKDFGLKILGPTREHLQVCGKFLSKDTGPASGDSFSADALSKLPAIAKAYKSTMEKLKSDGILQDMAGPGAAKNDESIVISVESEGLKALLTGDMQFGLSEMPGLDDIMHTLLDTVNAAGPYDFVKFAHHTSYNGIGYDGNVLDSWLDKGTTLFAHSGGLHDSHHPDPKMLKLLEARKEKLWFARTDRNGIITIRKSAKPEMLISKGDFNDFSVNNTGADANFQTPEPQSQPSAEPQPSPAATPNTPISTVPSIVPPAVRVNFGQGITIKDEVVEVTARIPHVDTKVTITVEVEKKKTLTDNPKDPPDGPGENNFQANGRFDNLLFVTSGTVLSGNIGENETSQLLAYLRSLPNTNLLDLPRVENADQAMTIVRPKLSKAVKGVVLLGGYDVVPPVLLDVLTVQQRQELANSRNPPETDGDNFTVYSDDIYGDIDGDLYPELPVSRIPDGRKASLVMTAMGAPIFTPSVRFGIRNVARPFAQITYENVPGPKGELNICEIFSPNDIAADSATGAVYYMLHGADWDATRFWGESSGGTPLEGFRVDNVPKNCPGSIVFTGCCWGALTALPKAADKSIQTSFRPRSPEQSIALSYLAGGANAFIGCTGSHYSPDKPPYNFFGKPMHDEFWLGIAKGKGPALALFDAKKCYAVNLPHGRNDPYSKAVEIKILREYSCLGIGW